MMLYVDSSALTARYMNEDASEAMRQAIDEADRLATARLTLVETGRALSRRLSGTDLHEARAQLEVDWSYMELVDLDHETCHGALEIAIETGVRTLDALHLGAMWRLGGDDTTLLTRDRRQARAAIDVGLPLHPASVGG